MSLTELTGNPRHDQLLTLIADRGYMNIDELAQLLDVSTQTVRRDIRKLSEQGLITRHHGGAGRASSVVNTAFEQREVSLTEEKRAIAEAIADYIPDGSTIFITIGTTVEHVARALLNHNHLRIITNSLRVAHILYKNPRFEVMVPAVRCARITAALSACGNGVCVWLPGGLPRDQRGGDRARRRDDGI